MDEAVRQAFTDAWNFYKKYANMSDTDEAWEALKEEGQQVIEKNMNKTFTRALINAVNGDIERKLKEKRPIK